MTSPMTSEEITVAVAIYDTAPSFSGAKAGRMSIMHLGIGGDPLLYASFDGVTDSMVLRPGTPSAVQATGGVSYKHVWLRCASATVDACVTHEAATADFR